MIVDFAGRGEPTDEDLAPHGAVMSRSRALHDHVRDRRPVLAPRPDPARIDLSQRAHRRRGPRCAALGGVVAAERLIVSGYATAVPESLLLRDPRDDWLHVSYEVGRLKTDAARQTRPSTSSEARRPARASSANAPWRRASPPPEAATSSSTNSPATTRSSAATWRSSTTCRRRRRGRDRGRHGALRPRPAGDRASGRRQAAAPRRARRCSDFLDEQTGSSGSRLLDRTRAWPTSP